MDDAALLAEFQAAVTEFERHRTFVERARARAGQFPAEVVNLVVSDHIERSMAAVERVIPLQGRLEKIAATLDTRCAAIRRSSAPIEESRQEIELRAMIGEITDDERDAELAAVDHQLEQVRYELGALDAQLSATRGALDRWSSLGHDAGVLVPDAPDALAVAPRRSVPPPPAPSGVLEELDLLPDG